MITYYFILQDRVKQALKQQELEESSGHRRKRKSAVLNVKDIEVNEKDIEVKEKNDEELKNKVKEDKDEKPKIKRKSLPPPIGFAELLKLAEVKQHEPVVMEVKPKIENERLMTKRQKMEYIQEKERKEQREKKNLEINKKTSITNVSGKLDKTQLNKVSKASEKSVISNLTLIKSMSKVETTISKQVTDKSDDKHNIEKLNLNKSSAKNELLEERKKLEAERKQLEEMRRTIEEEKRKLEQSKNKLKDVKSCPSNKLNLTKSINKQISSKDIKPQEFSSSDLKLQSSLANTKSKHFPPSDVKPSKSKTVVKKAFNKSKFIFIYNERTLLKIRLII